MTSLAPLTNRVFNPLTTAAAGVLPGFGVLSHVGRRSGRTYQTPLLVVRDQGDYVVGLWYGAQVQWVKNVQAAGGGSMRIRGRDVPVEADLFEDPARLVLPLPLRAVGRLLRLTTFVRFRTGEAQPLGPSTSHV
jgi:deazaflavin-dependent oxidoreductase (nitroreductase family)